MSSEASAHSKARRLHSAPPRADRRRPNAIDAKVALKHSHRGQSWIKGCQGTAVCRSIFFICCIHPPSLNARPLRQLHLPSCTLLVQVNLLSIGSQVKDTLMHAHKSRAHGIITSLAFKLHSEANSRKLVTC